MPARQAEEKRPTQKSLRELLKEHPHSGQRVIGEGTVHVDAETVRQSKKYKDMIAKIREYVQAK